MAVAIADDEPEFLDYLQRTLGFLGHDVVARAETGRSLVAQCAVARPDLILTDVRMPEMDGLQAVAEIERQTLTPVVFISAHDIPELHQQQFKNCLIAWLRKPIKRQDLAAVLAEAADRLPEFQALRGAERARDRDDSPESGASP